MREIRQSGSEGGGAETNRLFLPLYAPRPPAWGGEARKHRGGLSGRDRPDPLENAYWKHEANEVHQEERGSGACDMTS